MRRGGHECSNGWEERTTSAPAVIHVLFTGAVAGGAGYVGSDIGFLAFGDKCTISVGGRLLYQSYYVVPG